MNLTLTLDQYQKLMRELDDYDYLKPLRRNRKVVITMPAGRIKIILEHIQNEKLKKRLKKSLNLSEGYTRKHKKW